MHAAKSSINRSINLILIYRIWFVSVFFGLHTLVLAGEKSLNAELCTELRLDLEKQSIYTLLPDGSELTNKLRNEPIPELKGSILGQILSRFYKESTGGLENWKDVNSVAMSSKYKNAEGEFKHRIIAKKPDFIKVSIYMSNGVYLKSFDGNHGWEKFPTEQKAKLIRDEQSLRRLANDSRFMNHLLYPFKKGKAYEYMGIVRESDSVCHKIRVHTEKHFIMDYFIDVETYLEVKVVQTDSMGYFDRVELNISGHKIIEGMPFPIKVETYINGSWNSEMIMEKIETNVGLVNWMFQLN